MSKPFSLPMPPAPDMPRKPFAARGSRVNRCTGCLMAKDFCICDLRPENVSCRAQVWLIMHPEEIYKPTNTGRLLADCLPETQVFYWYRTSPDPKLLALLADEQYQPFIIFPDDMEDYAHRVVSFEPEREKSPEKVPVFIILDGTWRQARRIFRKSPYLDNLPVLPLKTDRLTRYALRKPASDQHLCTVEVGIELLRQAGESEAVDAVENYFAAFNRRYAESRGLREEVEARLNR
ncbi:tRNA-uridine aminocarboxypropyltransferase [Oceanospirillum sanctuarii]|uniref:tRNA-uridine aminocarboxypropyltransferase n=1 Tax=Oceanospirillum sanctuarii TaxID=1434821 RepID=UPI000A3731E3|nr:DTW domain-containing protein [Oceanospirillum sanctuarii]